MLGNTVSKAVNCLVQLGRERVDCKAFEGLHQGVREAVQSVSVGENAFALHVVQHFAHLLWGILVMLQKRNKLRNGTLEVNVVFPERVIGIDEQRLRAVRLAYVQHRATS